MKLNRAEWKYLFKFTNIDVLRDIAIKGELRASRFRSVCWRLFLELLPSESTEWLTVIDKYRFVYQQIKLNHYNDPHSQDSGPDNPLSQDDDVCVSLDFCTYKMISLACLLFFTRVSGNNILKTWS